MTIQYNLPASIECEKAHLIARKINIQRPIKNNYPNLRPAILYNCKLDRNSEATIIEGCNPKKFYIDKNSLLDPEDGIKGDMIHCLTEGPLKTIVKKTTHTHQASHIETKKFTYAKLEKSFKAIENMQGTEVITNQK